MRSVKPPCLSTLATSKLIMLELKLTSVVERWLSLPDSFSRFFISGIFQDSIQMRDGIFRLDPGQFLPYPGLSSWYLTNYCYGTRGFIAAVKNVRHWILSCECTRVSITGSHLSKLFNIVIAMASFPPASQPQFNILVFLSSYLPTLVVVIGSTQFLVERRLIWNKEVELNWCTRTSLTYCK